MKTEIRIGCLLLCLSLARVAPAADTIYVSSSGNNQIIRYVNGGPGTLSATTLTPEGMAFDTNGNMYVPNFWQDTIHRIGPAGNSSLFADTSLSGPHGAVFDSSGNLYVANFWDSTVVKFDSLGQGTVFADSSDGLNSPYDLAFDAAGNLFVSSELGNTIHRFDSLGQGSLFASNGLNHPVGLAFDKAGNLYVANAVDPSIMKFDSLGQGSLFASNYLSNPIGLAFDSAGTLFVANWGDNTIAQFDSNGNGSYFAQSGLDGPAFITIVPSEPILEKYSVSHGNESQADGLTATLNDKSFGGGTARAQIVFNSAAQGSTLSLKVSRLVRPDEVVLALLVFRVEIRGYDVAGQEVYNRNLDGFTFGDASSGRWIQRLKDLPATVARLSVTFVGNYE